jgi:hypothetical protein
MNAARMDYKPEDFPLPQDALLVEVCRKRGLRATDACYEKVPDPVHGGTRSVRHTQKEALRRSSAFDQYCDMHSIAEIPGGFSAARPEEAGLPLPTDPNPKLAGIEPVRMQGPLLFGDDPYNSVQPLLRAVPVNPDGTVVRRATPVDEEQPVVPPPIKLKPPPPLKLEP